MFPHRFGILFSLVEKLEEASSSTPCDRTPPSFFLADDSAFSRLLYDTAHSQVSAGPPPRLESRSLESGENLFLSDVCSPFAFLKEIDASASTFISHFFSPSLIGFFSL